MKKHAATLRIGVAGYGYWGPNLVRTFSQIEGVTLAALADADPAARSRAAKIYPGLSLFEDFRDMAALETLDAMVVALPSELHYAAARAGLAAGKHVLVEKPLCFSVAEARRLTAFADRRNRVLMVGHLLVFHPAVVRLKSLVSEGSLGHIRYIYTQRLNLGMIRSRENALLSLAPHDISVIDYLFGQMPETVSAVGESYVQPGVEDTVFVHLTFPGKRMAHLHVSWLDPHKVRRITVVGDRKMAVFDDMQATEKLRVFDKGVDTAQSYNNYGEVLSLRFGDIHIPRIDSMEPLRAEALHFVDCVRSGRTPLSDARSGLRVVRVLEAAQKSLKSNGRAVRLQPES